MEDGDTELPQLVHTRRSKLTSAGPSAIRQENYTAEEKVQHESLLKNSTAETVPQVHEESCSLTVPEWSITKSNEIKVENVDRKGNQVSYPHVIPDATTLSVEDDNGQDQTALGTKIITTGGHDVIKKSVEQDLSDHIEQVKNNSLPNPEKMIPEVDDQSCQICDQRIVENTSKGPFCSLCVLFFKQCVEGEMKITRHSEKGPVCRCKLCHLLKCYVNGMEPTDPSSVICVVCKKVFLSSYFLRQHIWKCKPTVNALHCDKCFKYFVAESQLRQHKKNPFFCKKSESDSQEEYKCDICWKSFSSLGMIALHRYTHLKFDKEMSDMEKALEIQDFPNDHPIITKDGENSSFKKDNVCQKYTEHTSPRSGGKKKFDPLDDEEDEEDEEDEDDYIIVSFDSSDEEDKKNDDINSKESVKNLGAFQQTIECIEKSGETNSLKTETDSISVVESFNFDETDSTSVVNISSVNKANSVSVVDSSDINKTESISIVDSSNITETDSLSVSENSASSMTLKTEVHDERQEDKQMEESQLDETVNENSIPKRDTFRHQCNQGKEESSLDMLPSCSNAEEKDESSMKIQVSEDLKKTTSECTPEKAMTPKRICSIDELTAALGDKTLSSPENQIQSLIKQLGLRSEVKVTTNNDGTKKVELHFVVDDSTDLSVLAPKTKESLMPHVNSTSNDEVSSTVPDVPEQESNGPPCHLADVDPIPMKEIQIKEENLKSDVSSTEEQSVAMETTTNQGLIPTPVEEGLIPTPVKEMLIPTPVEEGLIPTPYEEGLIPTSVEEGIIPTPVEENTKNMEMPTWSEDEEKEAEVNTKEEPISSPDVICLSSDEEMEPLSVRDKRPSKEKEVIILVGPSSVNMQSLKGTESKKREHGKNKQQRRSINASSGEKFPLLKKSLNSQSVEITSQLSLQENNPGSQMSKGSPSGLPESNRVGNKRTLFEKGNLEGETARTYKCYLCTSQFTTSEQIKQHLLKIHSYYAAPENWSAKFCCCHCNEGFETFLKLSIHERTVHGLKLSCPVCGIFQRDHMHFLSHFLDHFSHYIHHCSSQNKGVQNDMEPDCPTDLKTYMKCSLCFRVVSKRLKYYDHIMAHHRKLFKIHCKVCQQEFCTTSALNVHRSSLNNTLDGSPVNIADVITLYTDTMEIKVLKEVPLTEMFRPFLSTPLTSTRRQTSTITEDTYRRNKLLLDLRKKKKEGKLPTSRFEKSLLELDRKILPRSDAASGVSTCLSPATALPEASSLIANELYVHKTPVPSLPVKNDVVDTVAEKTVETIDVDEVHVSTQKMSSDEESSGSQKMSIVKYYLSEKEKSFIPITDFLTKQTKGADKECPGSSKRKKEDSNVSPIPHKQARLASSAQEVNSQEEDNQGKPTDSSDSFKSSVTESKIRDVNQESSNVQAVPDPQEVIVIDDPELPESSLCGSEKSADGRKRKEKMAAEFSLQKNVPQKNKRLNLSPEIEGAISHLVNFWKKAKPMDKKVIAESKTLPKDRLMEVSPRPVMSSQTSESEKLPAHDSEVHKSHNESSLLCATKQISCITNTTDNPKSEEEKTNQACSTSSATSKKAQNMFLTKSVLSVLESNPTLLSKSLKGTQVENIISENTQSVHPYLSDLISSTNWKVSRNVLSKVNAILHHKFPSHKLENCATNNQDGLNLAKERQHIFNKIRNDLEMSVNYVDNQTVATLQTEKISVNTQVSKPQVLDMQKNFTETTSLNNFAFSKSEKDSMQNAARKSKPTSVGHSGSDLAGALKRLSSVAHSFAKEKLRKMDQTDTVGSSRELQVGRSKLVPSNNSSNLKSQNPSASRNLIPEVPNQKRQSFPPNGDVRNLERFSSLVQSIAMESIKKFGLPDMDLKGNQGSQGENLKLVPAIDFSQLDSLIPPSAENLKVRGRRNCGPIPLEHYSPDVQKLERLRSLVDSIAKEKLNEYGQPDLKEIDELQTESVKLVPAIDFSKLDDLSPSTDENLIPEVPKPEIQTFPTSVNCNTGTCVQNSENGNRSITEI